MPGTPRPDAVILVLNSTNLHSHLVLAARVIALGLPTLVLLNMADELRKQGGHVDVLSLARQLGTPVALVSATTGEGIVRRAELSVLGGASSRAAGAAGCRQHARLSRVGRAGGRRMRSIAVRQLRFGRAGWIRIFLHRIWGRGDLCCGRDRASSRRSSRLGSRSRICCRIFSTPPALRIGHSSAATGCCSSLVINGVWKGTGSVLVFLPQILLLFLVIGILEDSGYLARAAVIADRTMSRVGLNGKSFIPLLSAYACAVPAIMATRTIESKRDRIATILIAPFMTCSARLPVYTMVIAAFLPNRPLLGAVPRHARAWPCWVCTCSDS